MTPYKLIYHGAVNMHNSGKSCEEVLTFLAQQAQKLAGNGCSVSILVVDKDGLLRNGASPNLPPDYLQAIDGIKPDPNVGTCAAVAATGNMVITPDFTADGKWAELKHLPMSIGFTGAWSVPIKTDKGKVVGTFGTYCQTVYEPTPEEISGLELLATAACAAITSSLQKFEI